MIKVDNKKNTESNCESDKRKVRRKKYIKPEIKEEFVLHSVACTTQLPALTCD